MSPRTALLVALSLSASLAQAQHDHASHATAVDETDEAQVAFLQAVRSALQPFRDQRAAVAAGFRPLGPDMPHMGQHWVHPGRAVSPDLDPSMPAMLTYLDVGGEPVLTGAAFTLPVAANETPPAFPFEGAWHAHAGRLMDEAFGLVPHGARDADRPRLAMLHAWTEVDNPNGVWAADNWALPLIRRGLPVPPHVPPHAGRAVALVAGYEPFFREAIRRAADPTSEEWDHIDAALATHADEIDRLLSAHGSHDLEALAQAWLSLWDEVERGVRPATAEALRPLFGKEGHTGTHPIDPSMRSLTDEPSVPLRVDGDR